MPLDDFPVQLKIPVLWGDQDLFRHVNNCVHIRWFESARVAYWDAGMRNVMDRNRWGPILVNVTCNYQKQIRYPDTIHVGARMAKIGNSSLTLAHAIYSENDAAVAAAGHSIVVMFDYELQKSMQITPALRAAIDEIEGNVARRPPP